MSPSKSDKNQPSKYIILDRMRFYRTRSISCVYVWLINKLDNSIVSDEAEMSCETSSNVCKIELLFVTRDVVTRDVFALQSIPRLRGSRLKHMLLKTKRDK